MYLQAVELNKVRCLLDTVPGRRWPGNPGFADKVKPSVTLFSKQLRQADCELSPRSKIDMKRLSVYSWGAFSFIGAMASYISPACAREGAVKISSQGRTREGYISPACAREGRSSPIFGTIRPNLARVRGWRVFPVNVDGVQPTGDFIFRNNSRRRVRAFRP